MPPEASDPTKAAEWIRRARSNLARARKHPGDPDVLYEDLCFDAQQAVEKALKAVLVARQVEFPKTHSIGELMVLLDASGQGVPPDLREAAGLTEYAVASRYPGPVEPVDEPEHRWAIALAERVVPGQRGRRSSTRTGAVGR